MTSHPSTYHELIARCNTYMDKEYIGKVQKGYEFADKAHEGQFRLSGEPFIEHPLQTALYLADMKMDATTMIAALLHDVAEDCDVSLEEIESEFGKDVARIVDGLTKVTPSDIVGTGVIPISDEAANYLAQYATHEKFVNYAIEDPRVAVVKLSDRIHNHETSGSLGPNKRVQKAQETARVLVPIFEACGLWPNAREVEDLSLKDLNSSEHSRISSRIEYFDAERKTFAEDIRWLIYDTLVGQNFTSVEVNIRPRHLSSTLTESVAFARRNAHFDWVSRTFRVVIVVGEDAECYKALGLVHGVATEIRNEGFRDYIANPKDNGYQALHTTVVHNSKPVSVQIRSERMDIKANQGVAANFQAGGAANIQDLFNYRRSIANCFYRMVS